MAKLGSWHTRSSKVVYETPYLEIRSDDVTMPNGKPGHYGWLKSKAEAVYVVPITDDNEVVLVRQQRYTIGSMATLECVAGGLKKHETHLEAAHRELLEETGYTAATMTPVLDGNPSIFPSVSKTFDPYKLYIARGLKKLTSALDEIDGIESTVHVPISNVSDKVLAGDILCSQSIASLLAAQARLEKEVR